MITARKMRWKDEQYVLRTRLMLLEDSAHFENLGCVNRMIVKWVLTKQEK
jgi:hypothetical protein